jgi:U3 small nucleolar RNA-associated protein 14
MSSDEEQINPIKHRKLISDINNIVKFQHIKKPKRTEPAIKNDEFHLIKTKKLVEDENEDFVEAKKDKKSISIKSVSDIVRKNEKQKKISNQFRDTFRQSRTLEKPLEKVHADRIKRSTAYEKAKNTLSRWDAIVTKNKSADQLRFPLVQEKASFKEKKQLKEGAGFSQFRYKTKMMKEMEEIHNECFPKSNESDHDEGDAQLFTLEEMKERRKELARLKLRESHKMTKLRLQGKIKSKKYHRLKKKEELKRKLKEFEELKVTNPEAALKELEKIEKQRIQERANLRHKNTGTWAKNMKVNQDLLNNYYFVTLFINFRCAQNTT